MKSIETAHSTAVVVPAYNEQHSIANTITALMDQVRPAPAVIVDNASTDGTPDIIDAMTGEYRRRTSMRLSYIYEAQKGTGAAADTGFRYAIDELGASIIARTDADTAPEPDWLARIGHRFEHDRRLRLLGGRVIGLRDKYYRIGDDTLFPLGVRLVFTVRSLIERGSLRYSRPVMGGNMATRVDAYIETGGFPRTDISVVDEDIVYMQSVIDRYGQSSVAHDRELVVRTSMRRLRDLGYVGMMMHFAIPERRHGRPLRQVDVR